MCGRYALYGPISRHRGYEQVVFTFLNRSVAFVPHYNAAPTQYLPVYRIDPERGRALATPNAMQPPYTIIFTANGAEAENRIKEAQRGLFAIRTSCHYFAAHQFRILLSALAYTLVEWLRALVLQGTVLAKAQVATLRSKLLKLDAVITRTTRRIRLCFASQWPMAAVFQHALNALSSP